VDLELFTQENNQPVGRVVNISLGGLLVYTNVEYGIGEHHAFVIHFLEVDGNSVDFRFNAKVAWLTQEFSAAEEFALGLQFVEHEALQYEFLQKMLHLYGKKEK
jgi:Tfp pilus assembly protein PilZ